jgi:hypothetical protein
MPSYLAAEAYILERHGLSGREVAAALEGLCRRAGLEPDREAIRYAILEAHRWTCERLTVAHETDDVARELERMSVQGLALAALWEVRDCVDIDDAVRMARQRALELGRDSERVGAVVQIALDKVGEIG